MEKKMNVLIACEYSGVVRDAFIKRGHNAISCDIIPTEQPGPHLQGDVTKLLQFEWDLIIAHPPCTFLSNAGARFLYPNGKLNIVRYQNGLKAKAFFMMILKSKTKKICVENPVQSLVYKIPKYNQIIQPWMFGHEFSKTTCLWLKNLPKLIPTNIVDRREPTTSAKWFNKGGVDRAKNRAKTFVGIANAMANQWG